MSKKLKLAAVAAVVTVALGGTSAYAALSDDTQFSQVINEGALATFIGDENANEVASPSVVFGAVSASTTAQNSTGTYGTSSERIYVDNPAGANDGWTLTLAADGGAGAVWTNGTNTYPFNAATADAGQLTIDPSVGTITPVVGTVTGITPGSAHTFSNGTNGPVTLLTASAGSDDVNLVYLTGVAATQRIPAGTPPGTYTIDFTQTVAAV